MNVNILSTRVWIVTDQFCWLTEKEDGEKGGKGVIIWGRRLIKDQYCYTQGNAASN